MDSILQSQDITLEMLKDIAMGSIDIKYTESNTIV